MQGTLSNLKSVGLPGALTGPIARGDVGTVKRHLEALKAMPGDLVRLYRSLARKTVEIALQKGSLENEDAQRILDLLDRPAIPGTPTEE